MALATKSRTTKRQTRNSVEHLPMNQLWRAHNRALARLTLATAGRVHELLLPLQTRLSDGVRASARADGTAAPQALIRLSNELTPRWAQAMSDYKALLERSREHAASLPFGVLVKLHNQRMTPLARPLQEELSTGELDQVLRLWQMRRTQALQAMAKRVEGDGLVLSQRVWRLDNGGLQRIRATLASGYDGRTNALRLARQLEAELGAGADLPRWAEDRLYRMTPKERMTSRTGLLTEPEHRAQGVSYNAVRLARTELQYANHAVTTELAIHNPAVTGKRVRLSAGHPKADICDEHADGGPYAVEEDFLPLHPNCMCYWEMVLMPRGEFDRQVREWMQGEGDFLDDYSQWLGLRNPVETLPWDLPIQDLLEFWLNKSHAAEAVKMLVQ